MTTYNGLTIEQLDALTKSINIISDCAKNIEMIETINHFKRTVIAPLYCSVVRELQKELVAMQKASTPRIDIRGFDPEQAPYLMEAIKRYEDETKQRHEARAKAIKEQIEKYNIWLTPTPVPSTTKTAAKPATSTESTVDDIVKFIVAAAADAL